MTLRQLMIQAGRAYRAGSASTGTIAASHAGGPASPRRRGPARARRPAKAAHRTGGVPLDLRTAVRKSPGCSTAAAKPPTSGDDVRAVDAIPTQVPKFVHLSAQVGRHQLKGAARVGRRHLAHLPLINAGVTTSSAVTEGTRVQRALALCYQWVASLMLPTGNAGAMAAERPQPEHGRP